MLGNHSIDLRTTGEYLLTWQAKRVLLRIRLWTRKLICSTAKKKVISKRILLGDAR
jgi:hypothetical protein